MTDQEKREKENRDYQWRQFVKLGDMMGDGLHHEPDGKWIVKEYNQLADILLNKDGKLDEVKKKRRQRKNAQINEQISERLKTDRCKCGGTLKQTRSGSKTVKCTKCSSRYAYRRKKRA